MYKLKPFSFFLGGLFLLSVYAGRAQNALPYFKPSTGVVVEKGAGQISAAFAGGLDAPHFAMADLDRDGLADLVIFSSSYEAQKIRAFLNRGTAGSPKWVYAPQLAGIFPANVRGFLKLLDYNCDGIPDLFHNGSQEDPAVSRLNVQRGFYNSRNELRFAPYKDLYYPRNGNNENVHVGNSDEPGIADVDGDGDIDIISYGTQGDVMLYYRNYRIERGLSCDSIQLELETSCWGLIGQGTERKLYRKNRSSCGYGYGQYPVSPSPTGGNNTSINVESSAKTLHGNNTVCLLDIDGDGDMDVLNSNLAFSDLQLQINGKIGSGVNIDSIAAQDTLWQKMGKVVQLSSFPTAYYLDIDVDGRKDIVVAPRDESDATKDHNQVWFYRNTGTAAAPDFQFQKDSLICEDMIDGGSNSHPLFYDFNKDGKMDILMGSTTSETVLGGPNRLHYYQNSSTAAGSTQYRFITDNLANVAGLPQKGCVPAVGDLDGDGKDDLLIGLDNGQFAFYKNSAASDTVQPIWTLKQAALKNPDGTVLKVLARAAPFIYDIDKNGLPDIVAGSLAGRFTAFLNTNIAQGIPLFGSRKDSLGGLWAKVDTFSSSDYSSVPYIGRIDSTADVYLIAGGNSGYLYAWSGVGTGNLNAAYTRASADFSGIRMPRLSAPAFGDVNGDGKPEMLVGNSWGGLFLYGSNGTVGVAELPANNNAMAVSVFPNPVATFFTVRREAAGSKPLQLLLCNLVGQVVTQTFVPAGQLQTQIEVAQLPAGLYLLTVQDSEQQQTFKVAITH